MQFSLGKKKNNHSYILIIAMTHIFAFIVSHHYEGCRPPSLRPHYYLTRFSDTQKLSALSNLLSSSMSRRIFMFMYYSTLTDQRFPCATRVWNFMVIYSPIDHNGDKSFATTHLFASALSTVLWFNSPFVISNSLV